MAQRQLKTVLVAFKTRLNESRKLSIDVHKFIGGVGAKALGAKTKSRMPGPDGRGTVHAEMRIGDSTIMLSDENPSWGTKSARTLGGSPISLHIYTHDVDALYRRAISAGCSETMPVADMFWGDRYGKVKDPFGIEWGIGTHIEDVSPEEMKRRAADFFAQMAK